MKHDFAIYSSERWCNKQREAVTAAVMLHTYAPLPLQLQENHSLKGQVKLRIQMLRKIHLKK